MNAKYSHTLRLQRTFFLCLLVLLSGFGLDHSRRASAAAQPPYPPSPVITGVTFDWSTHDRRGIGSDNWAVTWAGNDHQYTIWGDGGGFGGSNSLGRVSLGFARVEGDWNNYTGINVMGGVDATTPAQFTGKSQGPLALGDTLYLFRDGDGSEITAYKFSRLYRSTDLGHTWTPATWEFLPNGSDGIFAPSFLQFGRGYSGARDDYVYIYATNRKVDTWMMHVPGEIVLMRVHRERLMERDAYEFYAGVDGEGEPVWTHDIAGRRPVFEDAANGVRLTTVSYNAGLGRYLLTTEHNERYTGRIGIYDAPEPWGPWTTVLFEDYWGWPHIQGSTFSWSFSNKWTSADGKEFTLVFTGVSENDSWNTVRGRFSTVASKPDVAPDPTPTPALTPTLTSTPTLAPTLTPTPDATPTPMPDATPTEPVQTPQTCCDLAPADTGWLNYLPLTFNAGGADR